MKWVIQNAIIPIDKNLSVKFYFLHNQQKSIFYFFNNMGKRNFKKFLVRKFGLQEVTVVWKKFWGFNPDCFQTGKLNSLFSHYILLEQAIAVTGIDQNNLNLSPTHKIDK